jgi:uncharacterized protein
MENYPEFSPAPEAAPEKPRFYNRFIQAGREGLNEWWRYLAGISLTFIAGYSIVGAIPVIILVLVGIDNNHFNLADLQANETNIENPAFMHVSANLLLASLLFIFVAAMFFLWIAVRWVHKKRFLSVINYEGNRFDFKRYFFAAGVWFLLSTIILAIAYFLSPQSFQFVFQPAPFIGSLVICLLFLPIQTGWEEIFLRGYVLQGLALWMKKPFWAMVVTSVIFGLLHGANAEVKTHGFAQMLPQYILPGLLFGCIALLDERLELAMGLHFANNLFGILTVSSPDMSIQANSIWRVESVGSLSEFFIGIIPMLLVILLFWKKYKWNFQKLYRAY